MSEEVGSRVTDKAPATPTKTEGNGKSELRGDRRRRKRSRSERRKGRAARCDILDFREEDSALNPWEEESNWRGVIRIQKDARFFLASRQKDGIERDIEVAAQKASLRPVLPRLYFEARLKPLGNRYPLPIKKRILFLAIFEFVSAGRIVEAEVRHQMAVVNQTHGIKKTAVKEIEPVMVQSAINIEIEIRERGLSAVNAPGLEVIYRVMYSIFAQLANQTSAAVARRAEAFQTHRSGIVPVFFWCDARRCLRKKSEGVGSTKE